MRRDGVPEPYKKLNELTRGRAVTKETITDFIESLELTKEASKDQSVEVNTTYLRGSS
jgi:adenylosuccinate lyase